MKFFILIVLAAAAYADDEGCDHHCKGPKIKVKPFQFAKKGGNATVEFKIFGRRPLSADRVLILRQVDRHHFKESDFDIEVTDISEKKRGSVLSGVATLDDVNCRDQSRYVIIYKRRHHDDDEEEDEMEELDLSHHDDDDHHHHPSFAVFGLRVRGCPRPHPPKPDPHPRGPEIKVRLFQFAAKGENSTVSFKIFGKRPLRASKVAVFKQLDRHHFEKSDYDIEVTEISKNKKGSVLSGVASLDDADCKDQSRYVIVYKIRRHDDDDDDDDNDEDDDNEELDDDEELDLSHDDHHHRPPPHAFFGLRVKGCPKPKPHPHPRPEPRPEPRF